MRKEHPLWRGFWLAAGLSMLMAAMGRADGLPFFMVATDLLQGNQTADGFRLIVVVGVIVGAFVAALPRRIRRRGRRKTTWQGCLAALLSGAGAALGLGLAGGAALSGWLQGSVSAYGFALCAWIPGWITVRLRERRQPCCD